MDDEADYQNIARTALARFESRLKDREEFWNRLRGDPEDALQDMIVRCIESLERYDKSVPLAEWYRLQANFALLDHFRMLAKLNGTRPDYEAMDGVNHAIDHPTDAATTEPEDDPRSLLAKKEQDVLLRDAVRRLMHAVLTRREREAIERFFGFTPYEELEGNLTRVSNSLGWSYGRTRAVYYSALDKLRCEMRAEEIMGL